MCRCVCLHEAMCTSMLAPAVAKGVMYPVAGAAATNSCELPDTCAGNQTLVL